ncbi:hypothetical protein AVEN_12480-1 [Araneus ventricosus]|uniref:Uncharacterized protein n=1 Tax=Araneus ventricosus TaxID=182803 RepID=A0A4Y2XCP9_ARAVE|nr:hypothetical protein AVEN_12480-1 [Araneus ventricosus]
MKRRTHLVCWLEEEKGRNPGVELRSARLGMASPTQGVGLQYSGIKCHNSWLKRPRAEHGACLQIEDRHIPNTCRTAKKVGKGIDDVTPIRHLLSCPALKGLYIRRHGRI